MAKQPTARRRPKAKMAGRDLGTRQQTRAAYRAILRLIQVDALQPGDLLPKQSDLLDQLGMCQGTISAAMRWLVEDGVVTRRKCAGTVLRSRLPSNPTRLVWSVGIVMPDAYETPFFPTLTHFLHKHLALNGCADRVYIISPSAPAYDTVKTRQASDFNGLAEDIDAGMLDALVTPTRLVAPELPTCAAAGPEWATFGVVIDHAEMVRQACRTLLAGGARHLALLTSDEPTANHRVCRDAFAAELGATGHPLGPADCLVVTPGLAAGRQVADCLLARPALERPDATIILDDVTAQGLSVHLREAGDYRPLLAVQTNRQAPLAFALPVLHFEVDVEELARRAVAKTVAALLNPTLPKTLDWQRPELADTSPAAMLSTTANQKQRGGQ